MSGQCRFLVYKGRDDRSRVRMSDLVVKPSHSIITQSFSCKERRGEGVVPPTLNGDGFGIGTRTAQSAAWCGDGVGPLGPLTSVERPRVL